MFNAGRASVWEGGKVLETEGGDHNSAGVFNATDFYS